MGNCGGCGGGCDQKPKKSIGHECDCSGDCSSKRKCYCPILVIMNRGCQCGAAKCDCKKKKS
jgi:hypothetical protein